MYFLINGFTFKCILPIKVFYSMLNRTSVSIFVIPNHPEMWWRKRDSKVILSIYDIIMTTTTERLFNAWIHYYAGIRCKNKVNARRWIVCEMGWLVNNSTITSSQCNVYWISLNFIKTKVVVFGKFLFQMLGWLLNFFIAISLGSFSLETSFRCSGSHYRFKDFTALLK